VIIQEILTAPSNDPREELDSILAELCELVLSNQEKDSEYYGMVGACVLGPEGQKVCRTSYQDNKKYVHAERAAIEAYGDISPECIVVTTLSPCNSPMNDRAGESCEDLIAEYGIKHVYCGYKDPTQEGDDSIETRNAKLKQLCKQLADTFLKETPKKPITEYRDRLLQYVKSLLPTWPDYVLKDWLVPNKGDFSNLPADALKNGIMEKLQGAGLTPNSKWQLVSNMKFTMDMFDPMTKQRLVGRAGGTSDLGMGIPRDKERHATQAALAQQQGGVRKEPVLLIKTAKGYELLEGWHRTIQHFARYPDGYTGPAYVATTGAVQENFADGKVKGKSRPGRVKKSGASCSGSVTSLRSKAKKASGERARMYHWCANMKSGRKK
jgi:pyrimidine deaminase RibD-like protein